jgi:ABC-type Mn2+/Zn2+ transport system permease subunit
LRAGTTGAASGVLASDDLAPTVRARNLREAALVSELWRPFTFEFFRNGLVVATVAGALCALVGSYVVLRHLSSIGHGLSHAVLAGFAIGSVAGFSPVLGAGAWGLGSALLIGRTGADSRRRRLSADAAVAVVSITSFALGLALLQAFGTPARSADAVLFGNVLGVDRTEVVVVALVALAVAVAVVVRFRALLFAAFDPEVAAVSGLHVGRVDALLMVVLTLAVLVSMSVLGVTLVAAAIVTPAAAARLLTDSFQRMVVIAVVLGAAGGFVGMVVSYHLDIASGPVIVLTDAAAFGGAWLIDRLRARGAARSDAARPDAALSDVSVRAPS